MHKILIKFWGMCFILDCMYRQSKHGGNLLGFYVCLWSQLICYIRFVIFVFILTDNLILWMILCHLLWYCRDWVVPEDYRVPQDDKLGSNLSLWSLILLCTVQLWEESGSDFFCSYQAFIDCNVESPLPSLLKAEWLYSPLLVFSVL